MKKNILFLLFFVLMLFPAVMSAQNQGKEQKPFLLTADTVLPEMTVADNKLYIKNAPVGRRVDIITIIGNKVKEIEITSTDGIYELNLKRGVYIFKLDGLVRKFVVR